MSKIILEEQTAPDTPASGKVAVYPKTDGKLYMKNDAGVETDLSMSMLSEDTTPQLGGDLDLNGHAIDFPTTPNVTDCIDDDTMATASAVKLATSESIKAYVDNTTKKLLTSNTTVTVGASGCDYTTITDALRYLSEFYPVRQTTATIQLQAGYVWAETVYNYYQNFNWIKIDTANPEIEVTAIADNGSGNARCTATSHGLLTNDIVQVLDASYNGYQGGWEVTKIDDNTIDLDCTFVANGTMTLREAVPVTEASLSGSSALYLLSGARGPNLSVLLHMDGSAAKNGIYMNKGCYLETRENGCGVYGAGDKGIRIYQMDTFVGIAGVTFRNCASYGIQLNHHSRAIFSRSVLLNNSGSYDVLVSDGSMVYIYAPYGSPTYNIATYTLTSSGIIWD